MSATVTIRGACCECGRAIAWEAPVDMAENRPAIRCESCAANAAAAERNRVRRARLAAVAAASGLPPKYTTYRQELDRYGLLPWFLEHSGENLYCPGPYQVGKSHCAGYAAWKCLWAVGQQFLWLDVLTWLPDVCALHGDDATAARARVARARLAPLLIMDDLGKERMTDRAAEIVCDLINTRERDGRPTWITSNLNGEELEDRIGGDRGAAVLARIRLTYTICDAFAPGGDA